MLKTLNITLYSVISPIKSGPAERVVRTFKTRLYRYLMENVTWRYIDVLQDMAIGYNNTQHKTIGMAPALVRPRHTEELLKRINPQLINQSYKVQVTTKKTTFTVGDKVRPMVRNRLFQKSYWGTYWESLFEVIKVFGDRKPTRYQIKSLDDGQVIQELFYAQELVYGTKQPIIPIPGEATPKLKVFLNKERANQSAVAQESNSTYRTRSQTKNARR